ncbi:MAG: zinc-dependent alcohol dehydrogenase family protein [Acidiferrobacterales bacterium]
MKAVEFSEFGIPHAVCHCVDVEGVGDPADDEVVVDIEASPINPADLLIIQGKYPGPSELPARLGIEGVGRITAIGKGVKTLAVGDRVISLGRTNWAQRVKLKAEQAIKVAADLDLLQLAMLKANPPTALLMLRNYVELDPGDWVIQNSANSAVGRHVIRLARARGVHTVNLVRRESLIGDLTGIGADVVLVDGPAIVEMVKAGTDGASIKLGLDAIGGDASMRIADCLADGGTVVNYGFLSGEPCMITPHQTIVHDITLKGFWLVKALREMARPDIASLYWELCERFADGTLHVPVAAIYGVEDIKQALADAASEGRDGKILLTPNGPVS